MSKPLDLHKSVYDLVQEYPELVGILEKLGFSEITKPAMLASMGRMMTIPKGAKVKNISMLKVVTTLMRSGFDLVGEMPSFAMAGKKEENTSTGASTTEKLKGYLRRLGAGEDLESVRADFVKEFSAVDASDIMQAEQELMKEGTPVSEVQRLCDVHSALFHGATRSEQIANAEKEVEASLKRKAAMANHAESVRVDKMEKTAALQAVVGHPLSTYRKINDKLTELIAALREKIAAHENFDPAFGELRHLATHYARKGDVIYPLLKVRYGISGPSDIMWTVDDEIRHEITKLLKSDERDESWEERMLAVLKRAEEMIYKEENILFPICAVNFTDEEWKGIYTDGKDYDLCFGIYDTWEDGEAAEAARKEVAETALRNGEVVMPGGHMTVEQLTAVLNTIPIELTFIDENHINRFFNEGPKVFKRPAMAIDREVFSCHPPKIEPMVRTILDSFRDGSRDSVPVWMEKEGKPFLVTYMAVRDKAGKYLGTIEVVQDMSAAKAHFEKLK